MMVTAFDAIIVGAGPAGSSAAILLARAGWNVALVEKETFPRRKVCGECIAATNLPLLEQLGIGSEFHLQAGPPLKQLALVSGDHDIRADLPPLEHAAHPWGRALGREHLDWLLLQQAARSGATVLQPWTLQSFEGEAGNWQCSLRGTGSTATRKLTAPVLVIANGSWGSEHKQDRSPGDLFAFKAQFTHTSVQPGVLSVLAFRGGYGGMVLGDSDKVTLACCIRRDQLTLCRTAVPRQTAGESVEAYLKASCTPVWEALRGAHRPHAWLATGPIRPGIRQGRQKQDFFLIGNAAGEAHPLIGEGISMAIQSAWLLADTLMGTSRSGLGRGLQPLLRRRYEKRWRQLFAYRLHAAAMLAQLAMRPYLAPGLLPLLRSRPHLLTYAARLCGKVSRMKPGDYLHPASG